MSPDDFAIIIEESPWAGDPRAAMAETLDLDVITNKVDIATWEGLEDALADGVTFYDPDGGVLGNKGWIAFGADNLAVVTDLEWGEDGNVREVKKTAVYRVLLRQEDGSIELRLDIDNEGTTYNLGADLALRRFDGRRYFTTPSECSA
jgi:hypothetical protein